jgi:hypothetical protein
MEKLSHAESPDTTIDRRHPRPRIERRPWRKPTLALVGLLLVVTLAYGALFVVERRLDAPAQVADSANQIALPGEAEAPPPLPEAAVATDEVINALSWLGRHSISQLKLTAPPGDNAYYYFSRLRQLAPDHPAVAAGFREIGAAFALMAEREIATGNEEQARLHIALARQMDPANEALPLLTELAGTESGGVWRLLTGWAR